MSAESLNTCTLSGNLGNDAEVRYTKGGTPITSFSLAVNRRRRTQDGSYEDETSWVDCALFGKRGEALQANGYLHKGARIAVTGHLRMAVWEADGGKRHRKLEVIVDNIIGMTSNRQPQTQQPQQAPQPQVNAPELYDEDIPF